MNRENAKGTGIKISVGSDLSNPGKYERVLAFDELGARLQEILMELGSNDGDGVLLSISRYCSKQDKVVDCSISGQLADFTRNYWI